MLISDPNNSSKNTKGVTEECSWSDSNQVHPDSLSTPNLQSNPNGFMGFVLAALSLSFFIPWFREKLGLFALVVVWALIPAYFSTGPDFVFGIFPRWVAAMVWILIPFTSKKVQEDVRTKPTLYYLTAIGLLLLLTYGLPWWFKYIKHCGAEPLYWLEGVSIWPSQLLRLLVILVACVSSILGHRQIKKMQKELQKQVDDADILQTFALPETPKPLKYWEVLFIGNWKLNKKDVNPIDPNELWKKYLGFFGSDMKGDFFHFFWVILGVPMVIPMVIMLVHLNNYSFVEKNFYTIFLAVLFAVLATYIIKRLVGSFFPGWVWRLINHGLVFIVTSGYIISQTEYPNAPARGDFAKCANIIIIFVAVIFTIFLITWVVENARLCGRLIEDLSINRSNWNQKAKDWAISTKKVAPECVQEWLDIKLVESLTETMQPLIFGPVTCLTLLILARNPLTDDWDMPRGLEMVFIIMLLYSISAEVYLQMGAKKARKKAIVNLTKNISELRNQPGSSSEVRIKRIEAEIERIKDLRKGAFRPWYEWPLLQSFGGLGVLKYILEAWENGGF